MGIFWKTTREFSIIHIGFCSLIPKYKWQSSYEIEIAYIPFDFTIFSFLIKSNIRIEGIPQANSLQFQISSAISLPLVVQVLSFIWQTVYEPELRFSRSFSDVKLITQVDWLLHCFSLPLALVSLLTVCNF